MGIGATMGDLGGLSPPSQNFSKNPKEVGLYNDYLRFNHNLIL